MSLTKTKSGVTDADILKVITDATGLSDSPAAADELAIYDTSASAEKKITVTELYEAITRLTTLGAAANAADEVAIYDASGSVVRKVTMTQALGAIDTLAALAAAPDAAADKLIIWDNSSSVAKSILLSFFPFSQAFTSTNQTVTTAGQLVLAHGFGVVPELVQMRLECLTAEDGYSIGDFVIVDSMHNTASQGASIVIDATNVTIRMGSSAAAFTIANKTTGTFVGITNTRWELIVKAWA